MLKNNYRKIRKKNDNDVDADVTRREYSNVFFFLRGSIVTLNAMF